MPAAFPAISAQLRSLTLKAFLDGGPLPERWPAFCEVSVTAAFVMPSLSRVAMFDSAHKKNRGSVNLSRSRTNGKNN
jgi:hypothetical protein